MKTQNTGAGCRCPLQFRGRQCEEETQVEVPGFVGHSLLVHRLNGDSDNVSLSSDFRMSLSFRTSSSDGVLFHANGHRVDLSAQVSDGVLVFRVSCGPQHIVFSDPRLRVDNGFTQTIELILSVQVIVPYVVPLLIKECLHYEI